MNEAVFKAIGELLKEQQDLTTEQIKKIEDDVFEQITLVKLKEGTPGAPGEDGKDADPEAVAEIIVEKYADTLKGEAGRDGQDAPGRSRSQRRRDPKPCRNRTTTSWIA